MADQVTLDVKGLNELLQALRDAPQDVFPFLVKAMRVSVLAVQEQVSEYPPMTDANNPYRRSAEGKPLPWYERGRGMWYPVKSKSLIELRVNERGGYGKTRGVLRAKRRRDQIAGYKNTESSELLGRSWATRVYRRKDEVLGVIGNNASYAEYVQGTRQSVVMAGIGWTTVSRALAQATPAIYAAFEQAAADYAAELAKPKPGDGGTV